MLHENKKPAPTNIKNPSFPTNKKSNFNTIIQSYSQTDPENEESIQSMLVTNNMIKTTKSKLPSVFLQVLPVTISNGNKSVKINALDQTRKLWIRLDQFNKKLIFCGKKPLAALQPPSGTINTKMP